jgi:hypothetical protein
MNIDWIAFIGVAAGATLVQLIRYVIVPRVRQHRARRTPPNPDCATCQNRDLNYELLLYGQVLLCAKHSAIMQTALAEFKTHRENELRARSIDPDAADTDTPHEGA